VLAFVLCAAEFLVAGFGMLAGGGVAALILGSIMLMETDLPFLQISWQVMVPVLSLSVGFGILAAVMALRAHRNRPVSGQESIIGTVLQLESPLTPEGRVFFNGESWLARADRPIPAGERVEIVGFDGLIALVRSHDAEGGSP